jgi:hypothetical protein
MGESSTKERTDTEGANQSSKKSNKTADKAPSISDQILEKMGGKPQGFKHIKSINVFGNCHRVNIYCNQKDDQDSTITVIAYSYFVVTDDDGFIKKSDPELA